MKNSRYLFTKLYVLATILSLLMSGCGHVFLPLKSAFLVFNDASRQLYFTVNLDGHWTQDFNVEPNDHELILLYDDDSRFKEFPPEVKAIRLMAQGCSMEFQRREITENIQKDKEGRNAWGFRVDDKLLADKGCSK